LEEDERADGSSARPEARTSKRQAVLYRKDVECGLQVMDFGHLQTPEECDMMVADVPECGRFFMFSQSHPDWKCRCCAPDAENEGPKTPNWAVYQVQTLGAAKEKPEPGPGGGGGKEKYKVVVHSKRHECDEQAFNFGYAATPAKCDALVAGKAECGAHFMFSKDHPDWACRCCTRDGADDGPASVNWDVFVVQATLPENRRARPPVGVTDPLVNLPIAEGPRPKWLVKDDGLVIDGRANPEMGGGILILQAVLMDASKGWGKKQGFRPRWLRAILAANRAHARKYGHALILRGKPTQPQLTPWQVKQCGKKSPDQCTTDNERENFNWEKHLMLAEYLHSPQNFSHVMMLDADAAFIQQDHNTLKLISDILDGKGKDLFLTDEDWLKYGEGRINGGLILAKNTPFTRGLFLDTFDAHVLGPVPLKKGRIGVETLVCSSNEQICLNDLWKGGKGAHFAEHTMLAGGTKWNHGAESGGFDEPGVEILHFMGGAKGTADKVLCDGSRDVTGEGPTGYGCKT